MDNKKIYINNLLDLYDSPYTSDIQKKNIYNELTEIKKDNSIISTNILPNTYNSQFVNKLLNKGEFAINKSTHTNKNKSDEFILAQNQIFIKKLLSPNTPYKSLLLYHSTGTGKCHKINTPILMYDGSIKMVQNLKIDDLLMGDDSSSRKILSLNSGKDIMYEIVSSNGDTFTVNSEHILCLQISNLKIKPNDFDNNYHCSYLDKETLSAKIKMFDSVESGKKYLKLLFNKPEDKIVEISVKDYIKLDSNIKKNLFLYKSEVFFKFKPINFDPYILGLIIGNNFNVTSITLNNSSLVKKIIQILKSYNLTLVHIDKNIYSISSIDTKLDSSINLILQTYDFENIIPDILKYNDRNIRLKLLAGLIDSIGYLDSDNIYKVIHCNEKLVDAIVFIAQSLGFLTKKIINRLFLYKYNYSIHIYGDIHFIPVNIVTNKIIKINKSSDLLLFTFKINKKKIENYYGFTVDNNNRYLLGNFIVTHNSCTSAHIVENFKNYFEKRALVLLQTTLQDNYRKELFNITKYNIENDSMNQCLGNEYLHKIKNRKNMSIEQIKVNANKIINANYEFLGYRQLGNEITKIEKKLKPDSPQFIRSIENEYSNRVIIIDEVHNMKIAKDKEIKQSSKALQSYILKYAKNIILVMLSATPMYDNPKEIIWIMNTLLQNDKKKLISNNIKMFDDDNKINNHFRDIMHSFSNNYVSYMRGENPINFPIKLFPDVNNDYFILKENEHPTKDIYGLPFKKHSKIKNLILIKIYMSEQQKNIYNNIIKSIDSKLHDLDDNFVDDVSNSNTLENFFDDNDAKTTPHMKLIQISNIVYPSKNNINDFMIGRKGFNETFNTEIINNKYAVSYKTNNHILNKDNLIHYAPKINKIIEYINNSTGIIFVYSAYLPAGILPTAIALEHQGYSKYNNSNILLNNKVKSNNKKYIIISGELPVSSDYIRELDILKSSENKNGDIIKIVLVSTKGIEGLDFKNIREIHILEPWYNLSRIQQIIGRGIRNNSHIDLPEDQRNTTIYQYINLINNSKNETIDYRMYRTAEGKQTQISQIERIMKESSIDCNLNKDVLIHKRQEKYITTAQNISKNVIIGDIDFSKECDYQTCNLVCNPTVDIVKTTVNNKKYIEYETIIAKNIIKKYLNTNNKLYFSIDDIKNLAITNIEILYNALFELQNFKEEFKINNVNGYIIYKSHYYIFQPIDIDNTKITIDDRKNEKIRKIPKNVSLSMRKEPEYANNTNVINPHFKMYLDNIINNIEINTKNIDLNIVYNMAFDRLNKIDIIALLTYLVTDKVINEDKINLINALKNNKLFIFDESSPPNLKAYYDIFETDDIKYKCFDYNRNSFVQCSIFDNQTYKKNFFRYMHQKYKDMPFSKIDNKDIYHGFVQKQKDKLIVKIIDVIDYKQASAGTSCMNANPFTIAKINELFKVIFDITISRKFNKSTLCDFYEYLLRLNNTKSLKFSTSDIMIYDIYKHKNLKL